MEPYDPTLHDAPSVLAHAGEWADAPDASMEEVLQRPMWRVKTSPFYLFSPRTLLVPMATQGVALDSNGKPESPFAHNGKVGRGRLGKWGVNHAADAVVTAFFSGKLYALCIYRADQEGLTAALPGGMVDFPLEDHKQAAFRELFEEAVCVIEEEDEAAIRAAFRAATVLYAGVVDDPRNTRNAWIETQAFHVHLSDADAACLVLREEGDDDGETKGAFWMPVTSEALDGMYSHTHARLVAHANRNLTLQSLCSAFFFMGIAAAAVAAAFFFQ